MRPTLEVEEDETKKVLEGEVEKDKKELFGEEFVGDTGAVVEEALALSTRRQPSISSWV